MADESGNASQLQHIGSTKEEEIQLIFVKD
jgi:hypothetical protein